MQMKKEKENQGVKKQTVLEVLEGGRGKIRIYWMEREIGRYWGRGR